MMSILQMSKLYCLRPSEVIGLYDEYEAFCFDEACNCIAYHLMNEEEANYREFDEKGERKKNHYKSFSDLYKQFN